MVPGDKANICIVYCVLPSFVIDIEDWSRDPSLSP